MKKSKNSRNHIKRTNELDLVRLPYTTNNQTVFVYYKSLLKKINKKLSSKIVETWGCSSVDGSSQLKGEKRVLELAIQYEQWGYNTIYPRQSFTCMPDLYIVHPVYGTIVKVIESTNYSKPEYYINEKKFGRYCKNLSRYPYAQRELVVSFLSNISKEKFLKLNKQGIILRVIGHPD